VQVTGAAWRAAMRIMAGVADFVHRIRDGRTTRVLGGQTIKGSDDIVCDRWSDASKLRSMVSHWFGLKTTGAVSPGLASKL
jgi:hypothetical protein